MAKTINVFAGVHPAEVEALRYQLAGIISNYGGTVVKTIVYEIIEANRKQKERHDKIYSRLKGLTHGPDD